MPGSTSFGLGTMGRGFSALGANRSSSEVPFVPSAEALAIFATFTTPLDLAHQRAINNRIAALQAPLDVWSKFDIFYVWNTAPDATGWFTNWKSPGSNTGALISGGGITQVADRGYQFDGVGVFNSNYNPDGVGKQYTLNNGCFGLESRTVGTVAMNDCGARAGSFAVFGTVRNASSQTQFRANDATTSTIAGVTDGTGLFVWSRLNATTKRVYQNAVQVGSDAAVAASVLPGAGPMYFGGANGGTISNRLLSAGFMGADLSAAEQAQYLAAKVAYDAELGIPAP